MKPPSHKPRKIAARSVKHGPTRASISTEEWQIFRRQISDFPELTIAADHQGKVVFLNRSARAFFLGSDATHEGLPNWTEIIQTDFPAKISHLVDNCLREGAVVHRIPARLTDRKGRRHQASLTLSPLRARGEEIGGCFAMLGAVTPEVRVQPGDPLPTTTVLQHFPMPFFTVTPDLSITYMNQRLESLCGYSAEEAVGRMTCAELLCTDQCGTEECLLKVAMTQKMPRAGVRRVIRDREGREIPVVANVSILTDENGTVVGGFEAIRDITPIVEAEKQIEMITEMSEEGILMLDDSGRIVFANTRMAEILETPKSTLLGMRSRDVLSPQHEEMLRAVSRRVADEQQRQVRYCDVMELRRDSLQGERIFENCVAASRVGKGVTVYLYLRDLTERIEIERQLRETNNFLHKIIQSSVDGIVVVDTAGNVLIFNEGAERILGYKAEEVIGRPQIFQRFYEPDEAREIMRRMRSDAYGPPGKLNTTRLTFIAKTGEEIPVNFSAALIMEGEREIGSVGIFSDLREHLQIRRELEEAKIQLLQAEKIASLGRLAAGVAHEINNPLAGILIYADILLRELADHPSWSKDIEEIIHQTLRCKEIVTRLLEFSRQSTGETVRFEVGDLIGRCVQLLEHQSLFHDVRIRQDLQADLPQMFADPGQLQQLFTNLMINAANAMDGKGTLTISGKYQAHSNKVILEFRDTGPGVPDEIKGKIFEPFFTTKPPGQGTGLGLSVAYGVVRQHGGTIDVDDCPAGGAVFKVVLPVEPTET